MVDIKLTCGRVAVVDEADYAAVAVHSWRSQRANQKDERYYVYATIDGKKTYLHRFLAGACISVDHRNGNGLDNRRDNLRKATRSQNNANKHTTNPTGCRGVFPTRYGSFQARISDWTRPGRYRLLGKFQTVEEAARAYDKAAFDKWGEFARLNFPDTHERIAA